MGDMFSLAAFSGLVADSAVVLSGFRPLIVFLGGLALLGSLISFLVAQFAARSTSGDVASSGSGSSGSSGSAGITRAVKSPRGFNARVTGATTFTHEYALYDDSQGGQALGRSGRSGS